MAIYGISSNGFLAEMNRGLVGIQGPWAKVEPVVGILSRIERDDLVFVKGFNRQNLQILAIGQITGPVIQNETIGFCRGVSWDYWGDIIEVSPDDALWAARKSFLYKEENPNVIDEVRRVWSEKKFAVSNIPVAASPTPAPDQEKILGEITPVLAPKKTTSRRRHDWADDVISGLVEFSFGERVRYLRLEWEMTQNKLAGILHISGTTVSKIETGHLRPSAEMSRKLANFFKIPEDVLWKKKERA